MGDNLSGRGDGGLDEDDDSRYLGMIQMEAVEIQQRSEYQRRALLE